MAVPGPGHKHADTLRQDRPAQVVGLLSLLSFVAYPLRTNITVAAAAMMPDLRLTQVQMGDVFSAFQLPYALFQIPGGFLGDRFGARAVLTWAALLWGLSSAATGLVPASLGVGGVLLFLGGARALLGVGQAAMYPVGTMAIERHVPSGYRGRAVALFLAAAVIGSTLAPVLVSQGMVTFGWRVTFFVAAALAVLAAAIWWRGAPVPDRREPVPFGRQIRRVAALLRNRRLMLLSLSYMCQAAVWFLFVYWFYIYLTDVRGFTMLRGGLFATAPYVASAVIGPLGGLMLDHLTRRTGVVTARRATAISGMLASAACVLLGARLGNPYLAIGALALSAGMINFVEAAYWTTAAELGGADAGAAAGVLNTMGNLGGVFSASAVPRLVATWGWIPSMLVFSGVAVAGALLWLTFVPTRDDGSGATAVRP